LGYMVIGPSGWTRTTTTRLRAAGAALTLRRGGADPEHRTRTTAIPRPHASVTSDQRGANDGIRTRTSRSKRTQRLPLIPFALLVRPTGIEPVPPRWHHGMLPPHPGRTDVGCSPTFRHPSVVKDPARFELVGSKGVEPNRPRRGSGFTGRQRTVRTYCPTCCWRQRQDSNPDSEAWMLPCLRYITLSCAT